MSGKRTKAIRRAYRILPWRERDGAPYALNHGQVVGNAFRAFKRAYVAASRLRAA